jgi:hypothetical protein
LFQICGKMLSDKYKLAYHMKVHSDKRNFKCGICQSEFKGRENLRKHWKKFHDGRESNPGPSTEEPGAKVTGPTDVDDPPAKPVSTESKTLSFDQL